MISENHLLGGRSIIFFYDNRASLSGRQYYPWTGPFDRRLALDQFPTWLSLDGQQPRAAGAVAAGRGQSGRPGLHQLHGDISFLCHRGSGRSSNRSSYRAHFMGSAALLLGAAWLCTRGCGGLRDGSFLAVLQHRAGWDNTLLNRPAPMSSLTSAPTGELIGSITC